MQRDRSKTDTRMGHAEPRPRWYLLYYLLAALDVVTVLASLTLNHLIIEIYADSVAVSQTWERREDEYARLAELARAVNAPGNDVFDSRDVGTESARLRVALNAYSAQFDATRAEVLRSASASEAALLLGSFDEIEHAMRQMVGEAELIFGYFDSRQADRAGERMATMDRKFGTVNQALARLSAGVRRICELHFDQQVAAARSLKQLQYVIVCLVFLMIGGALYYGSRIYRAARTAGIERAEYIHALTRAQAQAEAANKAKSTFLAVMSHEIRTPLNTILLTLDMLAHPRAQGDDNLSMIALARSSGRTLTHLIDDLLDLSRIESGKVELESVPFAMGDLLNELLAPHARRAARKGVPLVISIAPEVPAAVKGDPMRFGEIVTNLVDNAVKFTDTGSIEVSVSLRSTPARDAGDIRRAQVPLRVVVRDTGIGLTADQRARIFEDFVQADESTTRKYGGTGLGLAIARRLVRLMNGELGVEATPGGGSTFWFNLDLAAGDPDLTASAPHTVWNDRQKNLAGRRVLLVEDTPESRAVTAAMLDRAGMDVDVAANGYDAVSVATANRYDAVLMDVAMPGMDGFEATRRIREYERANGIAEVPIIALTAQVMEGIFERCLDAGIDEYLAKPVTREALVAALGRWIEPEHAIRARK